MAEWTLPGDLTAPGLARDLVATDAAGHPAVDDLVLATSELVTNAVRYGTGPVDLALDQVDGRLLLSVRSEAAGDPQPRTSRLDEPSGRGLAIVASVASAWGWERDGRILRVWAEFDPD